VGEGTGVVAGTAGATGVAGRGEGRPAADGAVEPAVQAAHTSASAKSPAGALQRVINRNLPHEIRIREANIRCTIDSGIVVNHEGI